MPQQDELSFLVDPALIVFLLICWYSSCSLFCLDGFTVGNHPANYTEGVYHSVVYPSMSSSFHITFTVFWTSVPLCCASSQACADPEALTSCRDWLKGPVLGGQLLGLTEELCRVGRSSPTSASSANKHSWTLISLVLSQHHNNGENKHTPANIYV